MNFPFNFIVIPAIIIASAIVSKKYIKQGSWSWYKQLRKPKWIPSGKLIGEIWFFIYTITGLAVLWYWNVAYPGWIKYIIGAVLIVNAYYNAVRNKYFFVENDIPKTLKITKLLFVTTVLATILIYIHSPIASFLMLPYLVWVYLIMRTIKQISKLNK